MDRLRALAADAAAGDWMVTTIATVPTSATLDEAARIFGASGQKFLVVVHPGGEFSGLGAEKDLARALLEQDPDTPVGAIATSQVPLGSESTRLSEVIDLLLAGAPALVVLSPGGRPRGLITWESLRGQYAVRQARMDRSKQSLWRRTPAHTEGSRSLVDAPLA